MTPATACNRKSSKQVDTLNTRGSAAFNYIARIPDVARIPHIARSLRRWIARASLCAVGIATIATVPAAAADKPAINPPPSAQLDYRIKADVIGLVLEGTSQINWTHEASHYALQLETRTALTGVLLTDKSEGGFDNYGIAPDSYSMRRFRKEPAVANFDRKAGQINFAGNGAPHKLQGGEQDRASVLWQLLSTARARPALVPGNTWTYYVAGHRGGEPWTFLLKDKQKVQTGLGEVEAWHFAHVPADKKTTTQVDIWLAPSQEWFPVKIRFSEPNGDYIEQSLNKITRK